MLPLSRGASHIAVGQTLCRTSRLLRHSSGSLSSQRPEDQGNLIRENIVGFDVQTWVDKSVQPPALRVTSNSLRSLSGMRPDEFPWPAVVPATHSSTDHRQNRQGVPPRARGAGACGSAAGGPAAAAAADRKRRRAPHIIPSDDNSTTSNEEEDPPAPIPEGFVMYEWDDKPIHHFYLWTTFADEGRRAQPRWHRGIVVATLDADDVHSFTHDARFDGGRYPRSTTLTAAAAAEGSLVLMRQVEEQQPASGNDSHTSDDQDDGSEQDVDESSSVGSSPSTAAGPSSRPNIPPAATTAPIITSGCAAAATRPRRNQIGNRFRCESCGHRAFGLDFLYCSPDSPDGVLAPTMRCANCTEFHKLYNRELIGEDMGQFHVDFTFENAKPQGEIRAIESIFLGKKSYIDKLCDDSGHIEYHIRMKGIPSGSILHLVDEQYGGDPMALYTDLYNGKAVDFDLNKGACAFKTNKDHSTSTISMTRRVSFSVLCPPV